MLLTMVMWFLLLVICWPVAIIALAAWPLLWIMALPFRLVGVMCFATFAFLKALLLLPARLLGWRPISSN